MLSLKLRAILFPFQMEPRREELLHELGVRCPLLHRLRRRSCEISSSPCMPAIDGRRSARRVDSLLGRSLQEMWDEIGEGEDDRRGMLHALEEECLNVYRAKVEQVRQHRAQLRREIADSVAEVAAICATIGEPPATVQTACSSLQVTNKRHQPCIARRATGMPMPTACSSRADRSDA
jgi:protein regulator of cytokinesis 1